MFQIIRLAFWVDVGQSRMLKLKNTFHRFLIENSENVELQNLQ